MSEPNLLRIDHLRLQNFRCFAACDLTLHPKLTVLVAENAQGKTALLDALRLALQDFVSTLASAKQSHGFERTDIHLRPGSRDGMEARLPTEFHAEGEVDGENSSWIRTLSKDSFHAKTSTKDLKSIRRIAKRLVDRSHVEDSPPSDLHTILPVVAYYGTGRLYDEHRLTQGKRRLVEASPIRASAYLDCLSPSSSYKAFSTWFGQKWEQVSDPRFRALGFESRPENQLAAVRDAVSTVLDPTGWKTIVWTSTSLDADGRTNRPGFIALEHSEKGQLPLSYLSDGVRNMVALVGDLAHRCVRLNPSLGEGAAKRTPGIVLIDEVDMHLHPRWQQQVIGLLSAAFPCVQFVMSTHSPQVLTTVKRESIRILSQGADRHWSASIPVEQTKGVESAATLNTVMGVNPLPPVEETQWLNDYTALIEGGVHGSERGLLLRAKLNSHFGERHPVILDCDRLIRFQAFKLRKAPRSEI